MPTTAQDLIRILGLRPHPEGGHYRETYREIGREIGGDGAGAGRGRIAVIAYLLRAGERSAWHRIDAVEVWNHAGGAPLRLSLCEDGTAVHALDLGRDFAHGQHPHAVVPAGCWQSAVSLGDWTLVGCTTAPAFEFAGFELAPAGWEPGTP
jgi:predicted cupin superfamily sugar epimerase